VTLASGTRLGVYEVVAQIGAGGMGEVYRARDTRLNRIVAIKVLPAHLADKPERRERLERDGLHHVRMVHDQFGFLANLAGDLKGIALLKFRQE
jgi:serine/threonine protein kinase